MTGWNFTVLFYAVLKTASRYVCAKAQVPFCFGAPVPFHSSAPCSHSGQAGTHVVTWANSGIRQKNGIIIIIIFVINVSKERPLQYVQGGNRGLRSP